MGGIPSRAAYVVINRSAIHILQKPSFQMDETLNSCLILSLVEDVLRETAFFQGFRWVLSPANICLSPCASKRAELPVSASGPGIILWLLENIMLSFPLLLFP